MGQLGNILYGAVEQSIHLRFRAAQLKSDFGCGQKDRSNETNVPTSGRAPIGFEEVSDEVDVATVRDAASFLPLACIRGKIAANR